MEEFNPPHQVRYLLSFETPLKFKRVSYNHNQSLKIHNLLLMTWQIKLFILVEQLVGQLDLHGNVKPTSSRSTRVRKSMLPDDYIVYLQELDNDLRAEMI